MRIVGALVLLLPLALAAQDTARAPSPLETNLERLVGAWTLTGKYGGAAVEYRMDGARVLGGRYVEMHWIDAARPPQYEADVYVGVDTSGTGYIAHWIDNFGASYSVPPATGTARGDTISLLFRYSDADFRDTFVYLPATDEWHMRMESLKGGAWVLVGEFRGTRRDGQPPRP